MTNEINAALNRLGRALEQLQRELPMIRRDTAARAACENGDRLIFRALRALGRFPTQGEAATWLGRRTAPLLALETALEAANLQLSLRHTHELLHGFWTSERQVLLRDIPNAAARVQEILRRPVDEPYDHSKDPVRYSRDLIYAIDPDHVHGLDDTWRKLATTLTDRFPQEQVDLCRDIVRTAKLDPIDEADLLEEIAASLEHKRLYGYKAFFRTDLAARRQFLIRIGLEHGGERPSSENVFVTSPSDEPMASGRPMACEDAFRELVKRPDAFLETGFERGVRLDLLPRLAEKLASTAELDEVIYLIDDVMDDGCLRRAGDGNAFRREAIFRLFAAIGLDPHLDAAFVTEGREVGSRRYPGTWHLYPVAERGYVLALGMDQYVAGRLDAYKGDLETVKARLARLHRPTYGRGRSDADHARLDRELDPAPTRDRNFFKEHANVFNPAFLVEQDELRARVAEACATP